MNDFTEQLRELGPARNGNGAATEELDSRLEEIRRLIPYIKIQNKEKLATRLGAEEEYQGLYTREEIQTLLTEPISYHIDPEKCQACMICLRRCPVHGIEGGKSLIHVIDQDMCIRCGTCLDACPEKFDAVSVIEGTTVPPAIPEDERIIERKGKSAG
jgi:NAD-dependent dihydropyrimidine dehydrogenase PreA subunit